MPDTKYTGTVPIPVDQALIDKVTDEFNAVLPRWAVMDRLWRGSVVVDTVPPFELGLLYLITETGKESAKGTVAALFSIAKALIGDPEFLAEVMTIATNAACETPDAAEEPNDDKAEAEAEAHPS